MKSACRCNGWGHQDPHTYRVSPCTREAMAESRRLIALRKLWNETVNEGVPDWAAQLLAKMM